MTEPVVCKKGKCGYADEKLQEEWKDECSDCDIVEKIEHDLDDEELGKPKKRNQTKRL